MRTELVESIRKRIEHQTGPLPTPRLAYWLCGTPRTGSNILRHALKRVGCGHPAEGYHLYANQTHGWGYDDSDFTRYTRQMIAHQTDPESGIFGLKIFWEQFSYYLSRCDHPQISAGETLSAEEKIAIFFPDVHFLFIRRRNKVRQAISLVKAKQNSKYYSPSKSGAAPKASGTLRYNARMIGYHLALLTAQDLLWENFFSRAGLSPKIVWYEDIAKNHKRQVKLILDYFGLERRPVPKPPFTKQSDELSEAWYLRYLEENPWIDDPEDAVSLLANRQLASLNILDGEISVSPAIWWLRIKQLVRSPRQYLARLKLR